MAKSTKDEERKFMLECIDLHRELPALWKVTCEDYSNRVKKEAAYNTLLGKYRERYQDATKEDIKKSLNALRTNFRKELKKVLDSEKSGAGTEDLYESSLWYYDFCNLLDDLYEVHSGALRVQNSVFAGTIVLSKISSFFAFVSPTVAQYLS